MVGFINKRYFDDLMVEKYPFYLIFKHNVIYCDTVQEYEMLLEIVEVCRPSDEKSTKEERKCTRREVT